MARHAARTVRRRVAVVAALVLVAAIVAVVYRVSREDAEGDTPIGGAAAPSVSLEASLAPMNLAPGRPATVRVRMSADRTVRVSDLTVRFGRVDGGGWVPSVPPRTQFWVGILASETIFQVTFDEPGTFRYWVECQLADGRPPVKVSPSGTIRVR